MLSPGMLPYTAAGVGAIAAAGITAGAIRDRFHTFDWTEEDRGLIQTAEKTALGGSIVGGLFLGAGLYHYANPSSPGVVGRMSSILGHTAIGASYAAGKVAVPVGRGLLKSGGHAMMHGIPNTVREGVRTTAGLYGFMTGGRKILSRPQGASILSEPIFNPRLRGFIFAGMAAWSAFHAGMEIRRNNQSAIRTDYQTHESRRFDDLNATGSLAFAYRDAAVQRSLMRFAAQVL